MATEITYRCDRCGKTDFERDQRGDPTQLWRVHLGVMHFRREGSSLKPYQDGDKVDLCRGCVEELQLAKWAHPKKDDPEAPAELSFEEKLREVLELLGVQFAGGE